MNLLRWLLWQHRAWLVLVLASSIASAGLGVMVMAFVNQRLLDESVSVVSAIWEFALLLVLLFITGTAAQATMSVLGHGAVYRLRKSLVKRVLDTDCEHLETLGLARILASLNGDTSQITAAFVGLPAIVYGSALSLGGFAYLAWLSRPLFLATAGWVALTALVAWFLLKYTHQHVLLAREAEERLYDDYRTAVEGRKELGLNRLRARFVYEHDFEPHAAASRRHEIRADLFNVLNDNWVNGMAFGAIGLCLVLSRAFHWADPSAAATFALTVLYLRTPLTNVMSALPSLVSGNVALQKVAALSLAPHEPEFRLPSSMFAAFRELELYGVTYRYPGEAGEAGFELGPLHFTLKRGELVFLIGGNGSGKSSLARLLSGIYAPQRGSVRVDGRVVQASERGELRALFSSVFSDYWLFAALLDAQGKVADSLATRWLERLELRGKSAAVDGMLTQVRLSQGQRKRLALLVAALEERPVLLLDEWAADQDPTYREFFYTELLPELRRGGRTVIAVTHDDRYFHLADRIVKADSGRLVELARPPAPAAKPGPAPAKGAGEERAAQQIT